jgi:hypothetical protein
MPSFTVKDAASGSGWGCSCPAWRPGEPEPEEALRALARAELVTVEFEGWRDGQAHFTCWTDPKSRYAVTYDPNRPGGWCKHCMSALVQFAPWMPALEAGAAGALNKIAALEKEVKKLKKEKARWERKSS